MQAISRRLGHQSLKTSSPSTLALKPIYPVSDHCYGADHPRYGSSLATKGVGHLIRKGTGGRSSVSGLVATVFGATGFLGRYVVQQLAKMGSQVLVPFRGSEDSQRHLKLMGDLGQIVPMQYNPRDENSIKAVMAKANVVLNLIGREYETRNFSFEEVNYSMAEQLATIAKEHGGIMRFIQVSCLGASPSSPSRLLKAKAAAEEAVLRELPEDPLVEMHNSLKEMETQLVELKATIACLSTKIDLLSAGDNRVVRNKTGLNPLKEGKRKIGFSPVPITRSRRVWRVKRKSGIFEAGSTSGIGVGITPLVPEETMAPLSELKENGVLPRSERDVGSAITPEVKGLAVAPESPIGTPIPTGEPMGLALVPYVEECLESGRQLDIVAPLVSIPPIADWILPKVNEIQQFVGISHGGCEDQFKELITAIEASRTLETKSSFKKSRELQRLFSTINYDAKGSSSTRGKSKGRAL